MRNLHKEDTEIGIVLEAKEQLNKCTEDVQKTESRDIQKRLAST